MSSDLSDKTADGDTENFSHDLVEPKFESTATEGPGWIASQTRPSTEELDKGRVQAYKQSNKIIDSPVDTGRPLNQDGLDPAMVMPMRRLYRTINERLLAPTDATSDLIWADLKALIQAVDPNHPALKGEKAVAAADEQTVGDGEPEGTEQPKDAEEAPELAKEAANSA
ncbi:hypothetical protein LTR91_008073 [Friedmanniomyces endolithicus]|uniref:Uncharacterized protein n=1 Tax=Friedmanniomyces endolithicus TaxID=329885 RepID=A0A4V5N713_9PEZI|nr:hypothetical protein LTS09_003390 [Friedmanniomyces endolithicus]KAK0319546.1 hypothetical protein LTR82_009613 [Friedmanniomyces endolithicus]KAK0930177.1 hypothetical protein LTR57_001345 [Friedmanniomyces endolithicus]KAK0992391.1 hypothetical protein LTS01_007786 [Friedmanniomyces endolithicus]KAK0993282.1 hypothetical protein LTR91_008073 [Friedmanniomyces endolithicus]